MENMDELQKKDFERVLKTVRISEGEMNISLNDLRRYHKKIKSGYANWEDGLPANEHNIFFEEGEVRINPFFIQFLNINIPLKKDNYGFPENRRISIAPARLELSLNEESKARYGQILSTKQFSANSLFDSVGFIINNSMKFSPDGTSGSEYKCGVEVLGLAGENYKPTGKETMIGMCAKAGSLIRTVLSALNMEDTVRFTNVHTSIGVYSHDNTVVFDINSGNWVIINSKSPRIEYNLVPKDGLKRMGMPYHYPDLTNLKKVDWKNKK
jgi:hypothetical protein